MYHIIYSNAQTNNKYYTRNSNTQPRYPMQYIPDNSTISTRQPPQNNRETPARHFRRTKRTAP